MDADDRGNPAALEPRVASAARRRTTRDRVSQAKRWLLTSERAGTAADGDPLNRLRAKFAAGILILSILSACAVWRASVHEEAASQSDAHFRQELMLFQQRDRTAQDAVAAELSLFGSYEEHIGRAALLAGDAQRQRGRAPVLFRRMWHDARAELRVAQVAVQGFRARRPGWTGRRLTYDARAAYRDELEADTETELRPAEHRREAIAARRGGVTLTLVAALFIAGLVCMTAGEFSIARRSTGQARPRPRAARMLAAWGSVFALAGVAVFTTVGW